MMSRAGNIVLTGADGFLGTALCRYLVDAGWSVRGLVRNLAAKQLPQSSRVTYFDCDIPGKLDERVFDGPVEAFIHCAFPTSGSPTYRAMEDQVRGAEELIRLCRERAACRFIFISSMSAHEEAESLYGRTKLRIETLLDAGRDLVIRPGFIVGDGGIFQRLVGSLHRAPVVPLFYGGRQPIQTIHVDDLCAAIRQALDRGLPGRLVLAEERPFPIREFYRAILNKLGERKFLVPIPGAPALMVFRLLEQCGARLPMSADNLLGLKALRAVDVRPFLELVGVSPRTLAASLDSVNLRAMVDRRSVA